MQAASAITTLLELSNVHPQWREPLQLSMQEMDHQYLNQLLEDDNWLPGRQRLFAAFQRDLAHCRYILFGESPYPRKESANGIAFYDAAVDAIWSDKGLSKAVNRATSLRNLIKTALLAEGLLQPGKDGRIMQADIAAIDKQGLIQSLADLFTNFTRNGFLMMNATPVLHPRRKPLQEARYWQDFIVRLLHHIERLHGEPPTLVLWGKIASQVCAHPVSARFPQRASEHPYNLSFIHNPDMLQLFATLRLMQKPSGA